MNKLFNKENYNVTLTILICSMAVVVVFLFYAGYSYGWLSKSTTADAADPNIQVDYNNDVMVNRMIVYKYKIEENRATAQLDIPGNPQYMKMNQYDTIFTERNKYTPMVLMIPLESIPNGKFEVELNCTGELYKSSPSNVMDKNISNLIKVKCGYSSDLDSAVENREDNATAATFYNAAMEYFEATGSEVSATGITNNKWAEKTFVNPTTMAKTKKMTFTIDTTKASNGGSSPAALDNGNLKLYFLVDYQEDLVKTYLYQNQIKTNVDFLECNEMVHTANTDLTKIEFTIREIEK